MKVFQANAIGFTTCRKELRSQGIAMSVVLDIDAVRLQDHIADFDIVVFSRVSDDAWL